MHTLPILNKNVKLHLSSGGEATQNSKFLLQFLVNQRKGFVGRAVCFMNLLPMDPGSKIPIVCVLASKFYVVPFIAEGLVLGNVYVALKALSEERPQPQDRQLLANLRCIWQPGNLPASCRQPRWVQRAEAHCGLGSPPRVKHPRLPGPIDLGWCSDYDVRKQTSLHLFIFFQSCCQSLFPGISKSR